MAFDPKKHLINLKGRDYLPVAARLIWLNDDAKRFTIQTRITQLEDAFAIVEATVAVLDDNNQILRSATAMKREDRAHFPDFLEKSETGSIGRALGMLGYGTQFAPEFDELNGFEPRVVDSPQRATAPVAPPNPTPNNPPAPTALASSAPTTAAQAAPATTSNAASLESLKQQLKSGAEIGPPTGKRKPAPETEPSRNDKPSDKQPEKPEVSFDDSGLPEYDHDISEEDLFSDAKVQRLLLIGQKLFGLKDDALAGRVIGASSKILKRSVADLYALHWKDGNEVMRQLEEQAVKRGVWEAGKA